MYLWVLALVYPIFHETDSPIILSSLQFSTISHTNRWPQSYQPSPFESTEHWEPTREHSLEWLLPSIARRLPPEVAYVCLGAAHTKPERQATAKMGGFSALPEELKCEIVRWVAQKSLPALASVSRQLRRLVIPRLYRCVSYNEKDAGDNNRVNTGSLICAGFATAIPLAGGDAPLCLPSRISKLSSFLDTIVKCRHIRSHITTAGFDMFGCGPGAKADTVSKILDLLLPSLHKLDISHVFYDFGLGTDIALKSLKVTHSLWSHRDRGNTYLFSLFRIATLRDLSIENVAEWATYPLSYLPQHPARLRTSNVTSLSFPTGVPVGNDLAEILFWPKALEVFELGPPTEFVTSFLSPRKLAEVLNCQQHSLRELYIVRYPYKVSWAERNNSTLGDLHLFRALTRLCVSSHLLSDGYEKLHFNHSQTPPQIWQTLPPTIEELRLETEQVVRWLGRNMLPMSDTANELAILLSEIARHKESRYPNLQEVVVWQPRLPKFGQALYLDHLRHSLDLLRNFKESEIRLYLSQDPKASALDRIELVWVLLWIGLGIPKFDSGGPWYAA